MTGTIESVVAAAVTFVLSHFVLSSQAIRPALTRALGQRRFLILYSAVALFTFIWMILAWRAAPHLELWTAGPWAAWVPALVMPFAAILFVGSVTTANPTAVGGEAAAGSARPVRGILTVTRHPMLTAFALWALSHMPPNGDAATLVMLAAVAVLAIVGMATIDAKREASLGSAWGPIVMVTSRIPFRAAFERRCTIDWAGIGWWRVALGLALYVLLMVLHPLVIGLPALPA